MSRCNGRCNQGRDCRCFDGQPAADRLWQCVPAMLATAAVLLVLATGALWALVHIAQDCEGEGRFAAFGEVYECRAQGVRP